MSAIQVGKAKFSGASKLFGPDGLGAAVRGLAIDHARIKIEAADIADLTDNSTGTAAAAFVDLVVPTVAFDATSAGGALRTSFNTNASIVANAHHVLAQAINYAAARIGLPILVALDGTVATPGTIPAITKTVTTANGATALDFRSGVGVMNTLKNNQRAIVNAFNRLLVAIGQTKVASTLTGLTGDLNLEAVATAAAAATGASSISKVVADAFFLAIANNIATLAAVWNSAMVQTGLTDLTDSTGGVASTVGLAANAIPALAAGAATTSSPKAGFDAQLAIFNTENASLAARINTVRRNFSLSLLTDTSGGVAATTLAALSNNLAAVDGSTGTVAVDGASARTRMAAEQANLKTFAAALNDVCAILGLDPLSDALVGTVSATDTIVPLAATATGVGQDVTPGATLLDTAVDTWLDGHRNNVATIAAKLNAMTGTGLPLLPLHVVAID